MTNAQLEQGAQHFTDRLGYLAAKQKDGQKQLACGVSVDMVDAFAGRQIGDGMGGQDNERLQVVAADFGGDILNDGLLGQSGDVIQVEAVLEPLQCLLDTPALVALLGEAVGRSQTLVEQVGHQHALFTAGRNGADQAGTSRIVFDRQEPRV